MSILVSSSRTSHGPRGTGSSVFSAGRGEPIEVASRGANSSRDGRRQRAGRPQRNIEGNERRPSANLIGLPQGAPPAGKQQTSGDARAARDTPTKNEEG
jgi:hypothetical protein